MCNSTWGELMYRLKDLCGRQESGTPLEGMTEWKSNIDGDEKDWRWEMADILHRVGINSPADKVFRALSDEKGPAGW